jgi:hypothetical protein
MATAATVFRDYEADGVPASGSHKVKKSDVRQLLGEYESTINAFLSNGGLIYSSKAAMDADLAHGPNSSAWVIGDATVANNGIYRKIGASGTGSWTRVADLPFSFIIASDVGAGTPNAIQATTSIPVSASALIWMNVFEANTASPVTVSFNGGTSLTIKTNSGNDVAAGGLTAGMIVIGIVSGSTFRLVSDQASAAVVAAAEAAQAAAEAAAASVNIRNIDDRTALKALNTVATTLAFLREPGREGLFKWTTGDFSAQIAADTSEGVYVKADGIDSTVGAWVRVVTGYILPKWFGGTDSAAINAASTVAKIMGGGYGAMLNGGDWTVNATVTLRDGVHLFLSPNAVLKRANGFVGTMVRSENFATYTGTTNPLAAYPRYIGLSGGRIDGRYMNNAFTAYENQNGGNGIEIYAHKIHLDTTVQNIPGVGVWCESSTGNGNLDLDYVRQAKIRLEIQATKYEGLIWKGPSDVPIEWVMQTNAGARIASEQDTGLVSSPTYGGTNGGYTDGVVFDTGAEISKIHSYGNFVGRGVAFNTGRFNVDLLMVETCRYGGMRILGTTYGVINNLELHRTGGYNGDTQPSLDFQSAGNDDVGWLITTKPYHKDTAATTPRNLIEIGAAARYLTLRGQITGDNVPGHGIVIDGGANFIDIDVTANEFIGTAGDGLPSSAIYRKASFSTRGHSIRATVFASDVAFRSSGTPRSERVDIQAYLNSGQAIFAGDRKVNPGQLWKLAGSVDTAGSSEMQANSYFSGYITVGDDAVVSLPTPKNAGFCSLMAVGTTEDSLFPNVVVSGVVCYDAGSTVACEKVNANGASFAAVSTDVTGTTGTDGRTTVGVIAGNLRVENRTGGTMMYRYAFFG